MEFLDRFQNSQLHFMCFAFVLYFTQYIFVKAQADTLFIFFLIYFRVHVDFYGAKWASRNVALLATTVELTTARNATLVQAAITPWVWMGWRGRLY